MCCEIFVSVVMVGAHVPDSFLDRFLRAKTGVVGAHYGARFGGRFRQGTVQSDSIEIRRRIPIVVRCPSMTAESKQRMIEQARRRGMSDVEIIHTILQNVYGNRRRELVVEWGEFLGLSASDALRLAYSAGLLPSAHPPKKRERERLPDKDPGSTSERT
jgi:hypothetical protein